MTTPICAVLAGSLTGATQQGSLTPVPLAYTLDAQQAHTQLSAEVNSGETKTIAIPTNLGGPVAAPAALTMFIVTCDVAGVEITLNSGGTPVGPFQFPKAGGALFLPGQVGPNATSVPVSDILVNNNIGGSQRATVTVTAIYGP